MLDLVGPSYHHHTSNTIYLFGRISSPIIFVCLLSTPNDGTPLNRESHTSQCTCIERSQCGFPFWGVASTSHNWYRKKPYFFCAGQFYTYSVTSAFPIASFLSSREIRQFIVIHITLLTVEIMSIDYYTVLCVE